MTCFTCFGTYSDAMLCKLKVFLKMFLSGHSVLNLNIQKKSDKENYAGSEGILEKEGIQKFLKF